MTLPARAATVVVVGAALLWAATAGVASAETDGFSEREVTFDSGDVTLADGAGS
jgi:hypothetical protein